MLSSSSLLRGHPCKHIHMREQRTMCVGRFVGDESPTARAKDGRRTRVTVDQHSHTECIERLVSGKDQQGDVDLPTPCECLAHIMNAAAVDALATHYIPGRAAVTVAHLGNCFWQGLILSEHSSTQCAQRVGRLRCGTP